MVGYYHRFIRHFSDRACPLQDLITLYNKKLKYFLWTLEADTAFTNLKERLSGCITLRPVEDNSASFQLVTDASSVAIGAALHQKVGYEYKPIAFYSKKLTPQQRVFSTYDRELLAAFQAVFHFRLLVEGQQLTLLSDHKPLFH